MTRKTGAGRLHGDPDRAQMLARILRVDHAGEYGAVRIYAGQQAVLADDQSGPLIAEMAAQEKHHLAAFEDLINTHQVRPTALTPLWHVAGFALGAATAALGRKAAMACTAAVEEVIDEHYAGQISQLGDEDADLRDQLETFRRDEVQHREAALAHGAEGAPAYRLLSGAIKTGSRLAIWLSERV
jgi:ubiquinone biosynthesis monooxygenase Coq7